VPALDVLANLSNHEAAAFTAQRALAVPVANRLPLVRVVVPRSAPRMTEELADVLRDGMLKKSHKSLASRQKEVQLGVPDSLYFHLGRTHPDYGQAVVVLTSTNSRIEATPFGIGGLLCDSSSPDHNAGRCISPVAHAPVSEQIDFVGRSTWRTDWRDRTADFLALFFAEGFDRYFAPQETGRPRRADPEGIFLAPENRDWRAWTVEVRAAEDVNLQASVSQNSIIFWAIDEFLENYIDELVQDSGTPKAHEFPFLTRMPADRQVRRPATASESLFELVDRRVREFAL
jgi:hypothetical protein